MEKTTDLQKEDKPISKSNIEEMREKMYDLLKIVRKNTPLEEVGDPLLKARYETYLKSKKISDEVVDEIIKESVLK